LNGTGRPMLARCVAPKSSAEIIAKFWVGVRGRVRVGRGVGVGSEGGAVEAARRLPG
jgi:hypothetical protein